MDAGVARGGFGRGVEGRRGRVPPLPLGLTGQHGARARYQDMRQNPSSYTQPPKPSYIPSRLTLESIGLPSDPSNVPVTKEEVPFVVYVYQVK